MDEKKEILVNSSRGSGNVFCQHLMSRGLRITGKWGWHDVDKFEEDKPNIFILRNPYDAIGHAMQTRAAEMQENFDADPKNFVTSFAPSMVEDYMKFLDKAKVSSFIKTYTFEFLTQHSDEFLHSIGKEFDIDVRDNRFTAEEVIKSMNEDPYVSDKTPRKKSETRILIDDILSENDLVKSAFDQYNEYKVIVQSTENIV